MSKDLEKYYETQIANIKADKYYEMQIARIKADALCYVEDRKFDIDKTAALISVTGSAMSQAIESHRSTGTPLGFIAVEAEAGGWLFKKSCRMSIVCVPGRNNITVHKGWLK